MLEFFKEKIVFVWGVRYTDTDDIGMIYVLGAYFLL